VSDFRGGRLQTVHHATFRGGKNETELHIRVLF
jgi:hypothetical protein